MTQFSSIDVGQKIVFKKMIDILEQNLVVYKTAELQKLGKGFRGFNKLTLASPLTEGVPPAGKDLSMNQIIVTLTQFGDFTKITDIIEFLADFSIMNEAGEILGIQAAETIDNTVMNVIAAGTNVVYGDGTVVARNAITQAMTLTTALLERNNVKKFAAKPVIGRAYAMIVHPDTAADIRIDPSFVQAVNYSSPDPSNSNRGDMFTGELGYWMGARLISTTTAPVYANAGAGGTVDVYGNLLYGMGAYGVTELSAGLQTYIKSSGPQDTSNPLDQYSTVGWKWMGASAILDNKRIVRLETGATYQGAVA
jgi:N4-gp56 family major capsid protein